MGAKSQVYTCVQLKEDIQSWNELKNNNNTKWAIAIKEKGLYKQNADGSFEYTYIMTTSDSVDIKTLRNISINYITYYFDMNNETRAAFETNSPENGVLFTGMIPGVGVYGGFADYNKINANIIFDIRFKPNRIRFSVKIQDYQVIKTGSKGQLLQNKQVHVNNCFPLNSESDHKKSYAMAFINSNSKCLNYSNNYLDYLNRNIKQSHPTISEDW